MRTRAQTRGWQKKYQKKAKLAIFRPVSNLDKQKLQKHGVWGRNSKKLPRLPKSTGLNYDKK